MTAATEPTYVERLPRASIRSRVRTAWIQTAGPAPLLRRDLPTGGMEVHVVLGSAPQLVGPLTTAEPTTLSAGATLVGVRFWPGAFVADPQPAAVPAEALVDSRTALADTWGSAADRLGDDVADAVAPERALDLLEDRIEQLLRPCSPDALVRSAVTALMPWRARDIGAVAAEHGLSSSQLRRRFLGSVGLTPKVLQRTLRFQGYLALAQAAASATIEPFATADLAAASGFADQPHLTRECVRLTGLTPGALLRSTGDVCGCGHDHAASYRSFLGRGGAGFAIRPERSGARARSVQTREPAAA